MIKKALRILLFLLIGIIVAMAAIPYVFKDKIYAAVKDAFAENFNATIDFKDVDISLFRSFPKLNIKISDLEIIGIDTFAEINLLKTKSLSLDTDITPLFNKTAKPNIKYIGMIDPIIQLKVLSDGSANWNISKSDSSASEYKMEIESYEIKNGSLSYIDLSMPMQVNMEGVNHQGNGIFSTNVFDLDTKTEADKLSVIYDGTKYLSNVKAKLSAKINVNLPDQKYTLLDNVLKLNDLDVTGEGYVKMRDDGIEMDVKAKTKGESFKNFISVLPILSDFNKVAATGTASVSIMAKGIYNGELKKYPAFDVKLDVNNGSAKYDGLQKAISNIIANIHISSSRSDMKDLKIDVPKLSLNIGEDKIDGKFSIDRSLTDPIVDGSLIGKMELANFTSAFPIEGIEKLGGHIDANLAFKAKMSDVNKENYSAITFDGYAKGTSIEYKSKDNPSILINSAELKASPKELALGAKGMNVGKSHINFKGNLVNPIAYFSTEKNMKGNLELDADVIDMNEWMNSTNPKSTDSSTANDFDLSNYTGSEVGIKASIGKLIYGEHIIDNIQAQGNIGLETVDLKNLSAVMDGSDIAIKGVLSNALDFGLHGEMLKGDISLNSNYFDANKFMLNSDEKVTNESEMSFDVPSNVDLKINANLKKVKYTNLELTNLKGTATISDKTILINDTKANLMSGNVSLDGLYSTKSEKPDFNIKLDMSKIDFHQAYENFLSIKMLAPISKYIQGVFNTTLVMDGKLDKGFVIDYSTLNASGLIETLNGAIKNAKPINDLGEKLGIEKLKSLNLENTKNWFDIKNGYVDIKPFEKTIEGIKMNISGKHQISGAMDYSINMAVPRELLKKNVVTGTLDKGIGLLENEAAKLGLNIAQGEYIDLLIKLGGTLLAPTMKITPVGTSGKGVKNEITDELNNKAGQIRDSLNRVINNKKQELEDTVKSVLKTEVDKAKDKVTEKTNEVINEAKDKVVTEVKTKVDTLLGQGKTDSLAKKAEEIIKNNTGKDIDDIKDKIKDWNPFKKKGGK